MGGNGPGPAGKHSRMNLRRGIERGMPKRVHGAQDAVDPSVAKPPQNGIVGEPKLEQLRP